RTNTGQMPFAREPVAFHEIVRDAAEDAIVLAQSNQINVELQAVDSATVLGDRHRLRQMLLNLTENAAKYNQPNGLIRLSSRNNANHLILEVANTGPGIPSAEAGRIFERFFRGTNSIAREGVGLGLSIAQAIARAHHGQITVETNNLGWTIFRVFLPTAEAKPSASSSP
ncbi:MAG TPA: sensor histidine kinase, partial [Verrucomicrobiae bacterium]|nr:sensor histidine kinase [Verrucomicrobiae bacterium]